MLCTHKYKMRFFYNDHMTSALLIFQGIYRVRSFQAIILRFLLRTEAVIHSFLIKHCVLNLIPTCFLKGCSTLLFPTVTYIWINQHVLFIPLYKLVRQAIELSLDNEILSNYHPVLSRSFLSKFSCSFTSLSSFLASLYPSFLSTS